MSDERGFIRVDCAACNNPDVWFRCNACQKSDGFLLADGVASCACGATYQSGNCTCGAVVPGDRLRFVPFAQGPMALADLEIAWGRVAALAAGALGLIGLGAWWMFG